MLTRRERWPVSYDASRKKRETLYRAFADAARASGCVDCGIKHLGVLQSDHVRGVKRFNISRPRNVRLTNFLDELDKCETRCANCHQLKTRAERRAA